MGNLQTVKFPKKKVYVGLSFLVVFILLTIILSPMIIESISYTPEETATGNYVDMYCLANHPDEFRDKLITTVGI
ncbi:MAG: hypothetical protein GX638_13220, partial [Crenarchaeota archaeon]|nr:hypothetical protein [Thermoproteota archaeon]